MTAVLVRLVILSIFRQPLHVSGVSRLIIRRYNRMCVRISTLSNQENTQSSKNNSKYQLVYAQSVPPDNWPRYAQNM
jgi:hypothetical protein